jgi:hypothetical protein
MDLLAALMGTFSWFLVGDESEAKEAAPFPGNRERAKINRPRAKIIRSRATVD